jgi:two-component system response regulator GlrR
VTGLQPATDYADSAPKGRSPLNLATARSEWQPTGEHMPESAKILLVDDDQGFLTLLSMRLTAEGFQVVAVNNGQECLQKLEVFKPDVMISDLRMDTMDGLELYARVNRLMPFLPVVLMTAHGTISDAVNATQQGVFSFLPKPIDKEQLLDVIHKAIERKGHFQEPFDETDDFAMVTRNPKMMDLLEQLRVVAPSDASVLITGESGTGKELFARAIHKASSRRDRPFVPINCGAIPAELLESELFGHVRGSFTGASKDHPGLFQAAEGGTLFLDEIGDMPLPLQVKLLRVLEEKRVRPVGSTTSNPIDVRIISATHQDMAEAIAQRVFREDLYYRLNVIHFHLPSLRERREDIALLAELFLMRIASKQKPSVRAFAGGALEELTAADWPGNIRQLYNAIEKMIILSPSPILSAAHARWSIGQVESEIPSLAEAKSQFEREYLVEALKMTHGNVSKAARTAKRNRTDFYKLMARHKLNASMFKSQKNVGPEASE